MGVEVFVADEQSASPVDTMRWLRLARSVLEAEGVRGDAELSLLFVEEEAIADLNRRFLGKEGPTDVLAFPIDEEPVEGGRSPDSGGSGPGYAPAEPSDLPTLLGDVVICPAVAARNAPEHAGTYDDELALLVVHGILHLMGMDHVDDTEANEMEQRERELLGRFHRGEEAGDGAVNGAVSDTPVASAGEATASLVKSAGDGHAAPEPADGSGPSSNGEEPRQ